MSLGAYPLVDIWICRLSIYGYTPIYIYTCIRISPELASFPPCSKKFTLPLYIVHNYEGLWSRYTPPLPSVGHQVRLFPQGGRTFIKLPYQSPVLYGEVNIHLLATMTQKNNTIYHLVAAQLSIELLTLRYLYMHIFCSLATQL